MKSSAIVMLIGATLLAACSAGNTTPEQQQSALTSNELVDHCVLFREHAFACRQELVDPMLDLRARKHPDLAQALSNAEDRARLKEVALKEFVADGSGPLAARQKKCRAMIENQGKPRSRQLAKLNDCDSETTCSQWVACVLPVMKSMFDSPSQS